MSYDAEVVAARSGSYDGVTLIAVLLAVVVVLLLAVVCLQVQILWARRREWPEPAGVPSVMADPRQALLAADGARDERLHAEMLKASQ